MKIYVDELPKNCVNCDFGYANNFCELDYELDLRKFDKNQKHTKCPLRHLANHDKKVRAEVCGRFRKIALKYYTTDEKGNLTLTCNDVWDILGVLENSENSHKSSTGGEE